MRGGVLPGFGVQSDLNKYLAAMKLWLARHAHPLIASGICYGVTDVAADVALTLQAAQALARVLPHNTLCRVSPLMRCQQLAAALKNIRPDLLIISSCCVGTYSNTCTDTRLAEMDFGHFEGQPWSAISKAEVDTWMADFGNHRFGGQECANEVLKRVAQVLQDCQAQALAQQSSDGLWITHAGVIRAATLLAQGIEHVETAEQWPRDVPGFGCFMQLLF